MSDSDAFDVLVIGGGHAGIEAAAAAARLGARTGLVTLRRDTIGAMSCNPAIGGLAKGQLAREVDALGGLMGRLIDSTGIQFRMLNRSRGAAVRAPRAQADRLAYAQAAQRAIETCPQITVIEAEVHAFRVERTVAHPDACADAQSAAPAHCRVRGLDTSRGPLAAGHVVVTTGTFLRGLMHTGPTTTPGGRAGEPASCGLSRALAALGFLLGRLKTGTPPRLARDSIDWAALELQAGDEHPEPFSFCTDRLRRPNVACAITETTPAVHTLVRANLHRAPIYTGQIQAIGPRYCPSLEDKVVRFPERERHQVFLEPEGETSDLVYANGLSTSLPADVQAEIVAGLPGLGRARIVRYGYAVEYDFVPAYQLAPTLQSHRVRGLYFAGQINGTSGYEEAAAQGIIAGLNAGLNARDGERAKPFVLGRDEAYVGVLIDDLITRVPTEPYRMFTSRAEHRLLLRADNADRRLTRRAAEIGAVSAERLAALKAKEAAIAALSIAVARTTLDGATLAQHVRRGRSLVELLKAVPALATPARDPRVIQQVETDEYYAGYVTRQRAQIEKRKKLERLALDPGFAYRDLAHLRSEAREVLARIRPATLGQASRLAGVTPADIAVLLVALTATSHARAGAAARGRSA